MRKGKVLFKGIEAGVIIEEPDKYIFKYNKQYIEKNNPPISLTLPLTLDIYESDFLRDGWIV